MYILCVLKQLLNFQEFQSLLSGSRYRILKEQLFQRLPNIDQKLFLQILSLYKTEHFQVLPQELMRKKWY